MPVAIDDTCLFFSSRRRHRRCSRDWSSDVCSSDLCATNFQLRQPVVAEIRGTVAGAALGLALACDLRIASDDAQFVVGFLGIGLAPDSAVSLFLPTLIGLGRATEAAFTNAPITAQQALSWGLVNRVVSADKLQSSAY